MFRRCVINRKYFPALDGLRAVCITLVILLHAQTGAFTQIPGWLGVDMFFVISGFLITTLLRREESVTGSIDMRAFYVRRFFRIVPLYSLLLAFYIVHSGFDHERWEQMRRVLPYYLTFMNDFVASKIDATGDFTGLNRAPFGATWSLGIEEKFYLLWPPLYFLWVPRRYRAFLLPVLIGSIALLPFRMFRSYFGLLVGCFLAIALTSKYGQRIERALAGIPSVAMVALTVVGFMLVNIDQRFVFAFDLIAVLLVGVLAVGDNWLARTMSAKPMVWIGRRSYAMYLVQAIVMNVSRHFVDSTSLAREIALWLMTVAGSALIAHILFLFVEEPSRDYGKHLLTVKHQAISA